jgi:phage gpG-like protein
MLTMSIRIEGIDQSRAMLGRVRKVITKMEPGYKSVGEYLLELFTRDVFESEGAVYGRRWAPLDPEYSLWKSTNYPGRGILEATGTMRRGFRGISTNEYLLIRNPVDYLKNHQNGIGVPQRIVVDLQRKQRQKVEEILTTDIMTRLRKAI